MTPDRWKRLSNLFDGALDLPPAERPAFLARACGNDVALRREIERLLESDARAGRLGETPAFRLRTAPSGPALEVGTQLGRYEITGFVGAGGMGEVYRARDPRLDREVGIKVLPRRGGDATPDEQARLEREARAVAALNHPNILAVYDIGVDGGAPYIVSELLEGETLLAHLTRAPLPIEEVIDIARQVAAGLTAAHDKGIVHRDIKPENLFVTRDGVVKILDFGLAKHVGSLAAVTAGVPLRMDRSLLIGTAGYMAPEQVRGEQADARADVFGFGAVLYEMVTGRRAFAGDTATVIMQAVLTDDPPLEEMRTSGVPPALEAVIVRCLAKSVDERFRSAREVAVAIDRVRTALAPPQVPERWVLPAPATNAEAHEAYLKGRFHWNRRTGQAIRRAIEFFERALVLDPSCAPAHAGLAQCRAVESEYGRTAPRESLPKAEAAARRAIELDPDLSDAHAALGLSTLNLDLDWTAAEAAFVRASHLNPHDATAHHWYGLLLGAQGRWAEATGMMVRAQWLDPLSLIITTELAWLYHVQGLTAAAQEELRKAFEINEEYWFAHVLAGRLHEHQAQHAEARAAFETAMAASGRHPLALAAMGHLEGITGDRPSAVRLLAELEALSNERFVSGYQRAAIQVAIGDHHAALRSLNALYEERSGFWLMWLRHDPWFLPLHDRPEFNALIRSIYPASVDSTRLEAAR